MANKSVPQLTAKTSAENADLLHIVRSNIDYKITYADFLATINNGATVYEALISQNDPIASQTSGTVIAGQIWSITTFVAGDDFSNWTLISGTANTTGAVYKATTTAPTTWTNGSDLAYSGAPYVVSTDSSGDLNPFVNTIGSLVWAYISTGYYSLTFAGAFPEGKVFIYPVEAVPPVANRTYLTETAWWDTDSVRFKTVRVVDGTTRTVTNVCLYMTSIKIVVYP